MKVLVKHNGLSKFLFSGASWTAKEEDALDFEFPERAEQFCREHQLRDTEILMRPHQARLPLPVPPEGDSCCSVRPVA